MDFYSDIEKARPRIEESIKKFGYAPEHAVYHFFFSREKMEKLVFAHFADGAGLFIFQGDEAWRVFSEPIAPVERRAPILTEFLAHVFADMRIKKVWLELYGKTRRDVLSALPQHLRANATSYTLYWPVFDLTAFDTGLSGGRFKDLRNARSKFYREHRVEVVDARTVDKNLLHAIPDMWKKMRRAHDRTYTEVFHNYIESGFKGAAFARTLIVDGHAAGINAGWPVPNNASTYYAAIGLHDYSFKDLGDMLNLEDFVFLKRAGYAYADFAGGEKALTNYKLKFGEAETYASFVFSVVRR